MPIMINRDGVLKDIETLTPDPDGTRLIFFTQQLYKLDTVSIWVNGIRKIKSWEDGYAEAGAGTVVFTEAPKPGDSIQAQYDPA